MRAQKSIGSVAIAALIVGSALANVTPAYACGGPCPPPPPKTHTKPTKPAPAPPVAPPPPSPQAPAPPAPAAPVAVAPAPPAPAPQSAPQGSSGPGEDQTQVTWCEDMNGPRTVTTSQTHREKAAHQVSSYGPIPGQRGRVIAEVACDRIRVVSTNPPSVVATPEVLPVIQGAIPPAVVLLPNAPAEAVAAPAESPEDAPAEVVDEAPPAVAEAAPAPAAVTVPDFSTGCMAGYEDLCKQPGADEGRG